MGDEAKYLIDGTEVRVISETKDNRFVVSEMYEYGDEMFCGDTRIVDRVFDEPPTKIYSKQIADLQTEIEALEARRAEIKRKIEDAGKNENPVVQQIRDLLAGKFTHVLLFDEYSYMDIAPIDKLDTDRDGKNCFVLRGSLKRGYWSWQANHREYIKNIIPCKSKDEALYKAQEKINELARFGSLRDSIVRFAIENNLVVPQKAIDEYKKSQINQVQRQVEDAEQSVKHYQESAERYRKQLEETKARFVDYSPASTAIETEKVEIPF